MKLDREDVGVIGKIGCVIVILLISVAGVVFEIALRVEIIKFLGSFAK